MNALHKWMEQTGTNQTVLAARLGVDRAVLNRWVNGHKFPSVLSLKKLSKATGLSMEALAREVR